jgi:hypothetical protein
MRPISEGVKFGTLVDDRIVFRGVTDRPSAPIPLTDMGPSVSTRADWHPVVSNLRDGVRTDEWVSF